MEEWKEYKLGEITIMKNGKKRPEENGICPVYGGNGIMDYANNYNAEKVIIVGRVGAYCGNVFKCDDKCWVSDNAISVFAKDIINKDYLYYLMCTLDLHHHHIGAAQPLMTQDIIGNFDVKIPSLLTQRKIAKILDTIDDKIEVNRRINDNLEQQAQALYKEWFVDNPNSQWRKISLSDIADFISGYSYKGNELVDSSNMGMATIKNFERKGGFKIDGFKDIVASSKLKMEHHAKVFDILVAHTDLTQNADVIGNAEILLTRSKYSDIIFSMDLVKVLPKCNYPFKYLLAALLKNPYFKAHCLGYVNGTTVLHMSKKALPEYVTLYPSNDEAIVLDNLFKGYYQKMAEILKENEILVTLRDNLLPKLMSGELSVDDVSTDFVC